MKPVRALTSSCLTTALCSLLLGLPLHAPALEPHPHLAAEVFALVDQHFLDRSAFDRSRWAHRTQRPMAEPEARSEATALVRSLGDRYSRILPPSELARLLRKYDTSGGLNLLPSDERHSLVVGAAPASGSALARAGVSLGDVLLQLDGRDARRMTLDEAEWRAAQPDLLTARLLPHRGGAPYDVRLERVATPPRVEASRFASTGYVRLREFTASTGRLTRDALRRLDAEGAEAVVLDLRGNGGGAFSEAMRVAGLFLGEGAVVRTEGVDGTEEVHRSLEPQAWARPVEVWVDWRTASSSEVVVGALQDGCRATAVGIGRTYGKGVAQRVYGLSDGSALVQTILREQTPAGRQILGGLAPDEQRVFASSLVGRSALAVDVRHASFKPPQCPRAASAQEAPPWRTQRGPKFASSFTPVIFAAWLGAGGIAAWLSSRSVPTQ
ncbi:hypothetical protein AB1Y20_013206 [Prymnesium parvum]|uniref:PDZ domain-containing protein n=1 Tax=Prymnesium parvum TaxID=97485 RepID=A0AB34IMZ5_PRYPA